MRRLDISAAEFSNAARDEKLLAMDEALTRFEQQDPIKAQLVKLRFFAGLTNEQAASTLEISATTADRYWAYARAWLQHEMAPDSPT